jgi:hypothetical protein
MLDALKAVNEEIENRKHYCERTRRKKIDRFTPKRPHIAIIVDEYAVIRNAQTHEDGGKKTRKTGMEIEQELFAIVSQGAFSGCQVCLTSQRGLLRGQGRADGRDEAPGDYGAMREVDSRQCQVAVAVRSTANGSRTRRSCSEPPGVERDRQAGSRLYLD